ncbi:hypothetical protein [Acidovorax radicis]|jgi:hypothetical protein|uniref:hypothetical protein n=1 Tax=Acidovorax radicis TaxID=758826 RepID=UPI00023777D6|nr:hypothetical protein [Acidovorax radicis]
MKIIVKELAPGQWVIQVSSSLGFSAGKSTYPSQEAAVAEAERRHPGQEVVVE